MLQTLKEYTASALVTVETMIKMAVVIVTFVMIPTLLFFMIRALLNGLIVEGVVLAVCLYVITAVNEKVSM